MKKETLEKANELVDRIQQLQQSFECFEYIHDDGNGDISEPISLIIAYDDADDGRCQQHIPIDLNDEFIGILKGRIIQGIERASAELEAL